MKLNQETITNLLDNWVTSLEGVRMSELKGLTFTNYLVGEDKEFLAFTATDGYAYVFHHLGMS